MSSPFLPTSGLLGPPTDDPSALRDAVELTIAASRGAPPPELLEEMADADAAYLGLRESGRELRFALQRDAAPRVELHEDGASPRRLSVLEAFALAGDAGEE